MRSTAPALFGGRFRAALNWLRSRREVGRSGRHVFYTEYVERGAPERRYVEFDDGDLTDSAHGMPTEWWAWLHNRRDDPPTEGELKMSAARAESLQRRVRAIEDEDRRQQLRAASGRTAAHAAYSSADDVRRERAKERLTRQANEGSLLPGKNTDAETTEFTPEAWTPGEKWRR